MAGNDARMSDMQLAFSALVLLFGLVSLVLVGFRTITIDGLRCGHALAIAWHGLTEDPGEPTGWADACNTTARQAVLSPALMTLAALAWFAYALTRTLRASRAAQDAATSGSPR